MRQGSFVFLFACALAACERNAADVLSPSTLPAPIGATTAGDPRAAIVDWVCLRSTRESGVPLGNPVEPVCSTPRTVAAGLALTASVSSLVAAPTNLTASVNGSTVTLAWTGVSPVTTYLIEVGSFPTFVDLAVFDTQSTATSLVVTGVPPRNYYVRVRARSGSETSDPSNEVNVSVAGGNCRETLYPPFGWSTSGRDSSVTLAWEAPGLGCPPTEYLIEAGTTRGATNVANFRTGSTATSYTAVGVPAGTYYVRLRSVNEIGVSNVTEERILVIGSSPCVYSIGDSTVSISRGGSNGFLNIHTDPSCSWTMTADASWLIAPSGPLPVNGAGNRQVLLPVNVNVGAPRTATIAVRWPGGGADVPVFQNGFGS